MATDFKIASLKPAPDNVWVKDLGNELEIGVKKVDFEFLTLQLFILTPFLFLAIFNSSLMIIHLLILSAGIYWICRNILGRMIICVTQNEIRIYEGIGKKPPEIECIARKDLKKIDVVSKTSAHRQFFSIWYEYGYKNRSYI
jgi:hypothetical protein